MAQPRPIKRTKLWRWRVYDEAGAPKPVDQGLSLSEAAAVKNTKETIRMFDLGKRARSQVEQWDYRYEDVWGER